MSLVEPIDETDSRIPPSDDVEDIGTTGHLLALANLELAATRTVDLQQFDFNPHAFEKWQREVSRFWAEAAHFELMAKLKTTLAESERTLATRLIAPEVVGGQSPVTERRIRVASVMRKIQLLEGQQSVPSIRGAEAAISDAMKFCAKLPQSVREPLVTASEDGEVVIEWRIGGRRALVSFEGDGQYAYAIQIHERFEPGAEIGNLTAPLPWDLSNFLEGDHHLVVREASIRR